MLKQYLLTAGPTAVPERVVLSMARPMVHHRSPEFLEILREVHEGLRWVFQTEQPVYLLTGSGTAGMEAAIANFISPGEAVLCIRAGWFGDRWSELCAAFGVEAVDLHVEWGKAVNSADVEAALDRHPNIQAVLATASESSTGVAHPIDRIAAICRKRGILCVVDAISAIGAFDVPQDRWGIDVLVGASQKALMLPPGLALLGVSQRAWERVDACRQRRYYYDLRRMRKNLEIGQPTWTPAVGLIFGLAESLRMLREEGLDNVFARHRKLARATASGCRGLGLELLAPESPSPSVTAVKVPQGVDGVQLVQLLRSRFGVTISGGLEKLKGKIFRIAHMGYFGMFDIVAAISGVEMALTELGHRVEPGAGVREAERAFLEAA